MASAPRRSRSPCQISSASPTLRAASSASTSSQEPGNLSTPNFTCVSRHRRAARTRSPRRAGWRGASRTWAEAVRGPRRLARRGGQRGRWRRRRSRARAAPARRRRPAGRGSRPWAGSGRGPSRGGPDGGAVEPGLEGLAADALVCLDVAGARAGDDVGRDGGGGRLAVPAAGGGPVAHVLLVEARLPAADLEAVGGPVA